mmetsp:Transcript_59333/g.176214  ORF Transcript_59333/g.176214 Transcript_59333/m.176214 type:complete len:322 (-) Transcript_59333:589-1554(-)
MQERHRSDSLDAHTAPHHRAAGCRRGRDAEGVECGQEFRRSVTKVCTGTYRINTPLVLPLPTVLLNLSTRRLLPPRTRDGRENEWRLLYHCMRTSSRAARAPARSTPATLMADGRPRGASNRRGVVAPLVVQHPEHRARRAVRHVLRHLLLVRVVVRVATALAVPLAHAIMRLLAPVVLKGRKGELLLVLVGLGLEHNLKVGRELVVILALARLVCVSSAEDHPALLLHEEMGVDPEVADGPLVVELLLVVKDEFRVALDEQRRGVAAAVEGDLAAALHLLDLLELARVEDLAVALREARARQDARVVVLLGAKVVDRHEL